MEIENLRYLLTHGQEQMTIRQIADAMKEANCLIELRDEITKERDFNHQAENHMGNAINSWKDKCTELIKDIEANKQWKYDCLMWQRRYDTCFDRADKLHNKAIELENLCSEAMGEQPKEWRDRFRKIINK